MVKKLFRWLQQPVSNWDIFWAVVFTAIITFQPQYAHGPLNLFEFGLYLPSMDALLHGQVPYRDFFYLRGPLEIYIPAFLMKVFGEHTVYLSLYFYVGNVFCLIVAILIAAELLQTKSIFYAFVPVFIARVFPRVVFSYWGGLRYVWGLLFVYFMIRAFKTKNKWMFMLSGFVVGCSTFTSIEIGVACLIATITTFICSLLQDRQSADKNLFLSFILGFLVIFIPFLIYFYQLHALKPFIEAIEAVVFKSHPTFMTHLTSSSPKSLGEFILSMIPGTKNFKYMTPMYCYLMIAGVLAWRFRLNLFKNLELGLMNMAIYGLVLYFAAFRIIEGGQFETALQIEKILYFFLLELIFLWVLSKRKTIGVIFLIGIVVSSWGFAVDKYSKRFPMVTTIRSHFDKKFREKHKSQQEVSLNFERAKGIKTSFLQARELEMVSKAVNLYSNINDKIFVYPDMGSYYFLFQRNVVGRFPVATLSWMRQDWHEELMHDLENQKPRLIILKKNLEKDFENVYFKRPSNKSNFNDVMNFIETNYHLMVKTEASLIYLINAKS